jgi:RNA polymerase sigma-70 factor (ECF subfamily)
MAGFAAAFRDRLRTDRAVGPRTAGDRDDALAADRDDALDADRADTLAGRGDDALDAALAAALAAAHAAWPALPIADARFAEHLADLVRDAPAVAGALGQLHIADVYLSLACAEANPDALAILERDYLADVRPTLSRMGLTASAIDETLQVMRAELLAPRPDAAPRILRYGGRGHLRGWLRSVAARTGLRSLQASGRHDELDEGNHATPAGDLELAYMKKTYGEVFHRGFAAALAALATDDRLLLKQRFRHQLTVEELGALHSVHAGTISRWVAAARDRLVKATRAEMMRELGVGRADVSSILRLIHSELDITLSSLVQIPE